VRELGGITRRPGFGGNQALGQLLGNRWRARTEFDFDLSPGQQAVTNRGANVVVGDLGAQLVFLRIR
jgi:hypothetical protein